MKYHNKWRIQSSVNHFNLALYYRKWSKTTSMLTVKTVTLNLLKIGWKSIRLGQLIFEANTRPTRVSLAKLKRRRSRAKPKLKRNGWQRTRQRVLKNSMHSSRLELRSSELLLIPSKRKGRSSKLTSSKKRTPSFASKSKA